MHLVYRVDDFVESIDKIIWLQAYKLETKQFAMINVDIKLTWSIMISNHPFNFVAQNIKIIDFYNINSGFLFQTQCNYVGASIFGNILFNGLIFTYESDKLFKFKTGQFIDIYAPANVTISNSVFNIEYSSVESYDVFLLEDNGDCSPNDNTTQAISIVNNTFSFNGDYDEGFNNIKITFNDANKRNKTILVDSNTFSDMHGFSKTLLDIEYLSTGKVTVSNNVVRNWSSENYLFSLEANQIIEVTGNKFDSCIISSAGLIMTDIASSINISNLTVCNNINSDSYSRSPLIHLSGAMNSEISIVSSNFYLNSLKSTMIDIDNSVFSLTVKNNNFTSEIINSENYFVLNGQSSLLMLSLQFTNIQSDISNTNQVTLLHFKSISLNSSDDVKFDSLTFSNNSVGFLAIDDIVETSLTLKTIYFLNTVIKDSTFQTKNSIFTLGPIYNFNEFQFVFKGIEFTNIYFEIGGYLMNIKFQSKYPFMFQDVSISNIQGGGFQLQPVSTIDDTKIVQVQIQNISASDNDFQYSTLFSVNGYWALSVTNWTMKRNSAYFLGSIISVTDKQSSILFDEWNFLNNNGIEGGLFYVEKGSTINVTNSYLFGNFAVDSPIAYIENSGSINFDNWDMSYNIAYTVGLIKIVDSTSLTSITNTLIYSNSLTNSNILKKDINDSSIWIILWFASDGFVEYLKNNISILNNQVSIALLFYR